MAITQPRVESKSTNPSTKTDFKYDSPSFDKLSSEDAYNQALKFNEFNNRLQQSNLSSGLNIAKNESLDALKGKQSLEQQNTLFNKSIENAGVGKFGGSSSEAFGLNAAAPSGYSVDFNGKRGLYNASEVANWRNRQNDVLNDTVRQASKLRDVDTNAQMKLANQANIFNIDNNNRQASIDGQNKANDFLRNKALQDSQLQAQRDIAGIQAQGSILGSLFGSIGSGSPNYKYWG
jgi:hypothetical protein